LNVNSIQKNICQDQHLHQVLNIVQMVIDNEELHENNQKRAQALKLGSKGGTGVADGETAPIQSTGSLSSSQTYLFKEEFKLIMQLIFTLSEYDLKYEQLDQMQRQHAQPGPNDPKIANVERDHSPARPCTHPSRTIIQIPANLEFLEANVDRGAEHRQNDLPGSRNSGRQSRRDRDRRAQSQVQVVI
jgi:hypothetical protein